MPSPLKPRRSPRSRTSLAGVGSGGIQLGGSSMTTKSSSTSLSNAAVKENTSNHSARLVAKEDTMNSAKEKAISKKRAASVGGPELDNLLRESSSKANTDNSARVPATSRRNAPAPRKSAIRQVPQVFLSPTGLVPSPESRKGLSMPPLSEQIAQLSKPQTQSAASNSAPSASVKAGVAGASHARSSMSALSSSRTRDSNHTISYPAASSSQRADQRASVTQVIRPKRRVTFSSRQEKTEFARDEPTLRMQSLRREDVSPPSTPASSSIASIGFASFVQTRDESESESESSSDDEDDSDMDLDGSTIELTGRSLAASIAASLPHDDSTMDTSGDATGDDSVIEHDEDTVSMQMTGNYGSIGKRSLEDDQDEDDAEDSADTISRPPAAGDESDQMDMTQSMPSEPALKRRRSSSSGNEPNRSDNARARLQPSSDDSDMSMSLDDRPADSSDMNLDQTVTMELTQNLNVNESYVTDNSDDEDDNDEEDGMELTKAITTKIEAKRNGDATTTIVTSFPSSFNTGDLSDVDGADSGSEDGSDVREDQTVTMEMTRAATGFIRSKNPTSSDMDIVDQSSSMTGLLRTSSDDISMSMDMTVPMGGIADSSAVSPVKTTATPNKPKLGTGAPSPFQPAVPRSPSKFRQSLRGGMAALDSPNRSPAQRIGMPGAPTQPSSAATPANGHAAALTSFRRSIIGGVASPSYIHSPARRVQSINPVAPSDEAPSTPLTAANLSAAGLSRSAQKVSPSPASKFARAVMAQRDRKSLGGASMGVTWPVANGTSSPMRANGAHASPRRRAGRSSLVAAILPDLSSAATNDSFHSAVESGGARSSESGDTQDASFAVGANMSGSDIGAGVESFDDYSNDHLAHVPVQMPLNDFLGFVGVHFNDDMNASRRRPVPPPTKTEDEHTQAQVEDDDQKNPAIGGSHLPVAMMRLVKAACGSVPQLEALRDACREIKEQVDDGREKMVEMEQAFYDAPPDFVREIMGLQNEEEKMEMEAQFKLQKQAARALVCADYYGWRLDKEFDQEMIQTLQAYHGRLQCDLHIVTTKRQQLQQELLPVLRAKHAQLKADLASAKTRQAEIETCDADELRGLYSSIEEQHEVLESMRGKLLDVEEQHQRLLMRLEENRERMAVAQEMVDKAHATVDQIQGYTRGEAGRLLREIRNLEKLHLVRVLDNGFEGQPDADENDEQQQQQSAAHGDAKEVVLVLDGWLQVAMTLNGAFGPSATASARVSRIKLKQKNTRTTEAGTNTVRKLSVEILQRDFDADFADGVAQDGLVILRKISQTLIRQRILLAELEHLRCRFPVQLLPAKAAARASAGTVTTSSSSSSAASSASFDLDVESEVMLQASILLPNKRSKIVITATSDLKGAGENRSILLADSVKVDKIYGDVDAEAMSLQILDCIETDPTIGSLSKAFIETIETFDS
ncbi:hypothetical protein BCV70DRAFT_197155 [Testicularia cyperi]|uniref:Spc7 kinetochore protein domain-containing protein n=1 Tax=Testicularia cyperi TaxID=1882483 RepID=A0A317XX81_9BASI|nr:hypothetical protein BCV70DRAFT_197155 [Testicularia cyperi]